MLADPEEIDVQAVGQHRLVDHIADDLRVRKPASIGTNRHVAEGVQPEFQLLCDDEIRKK